jgi:DNA-binding transcriptional LysR family regulator
MDIEALRLFADTVRRGSFAAVARDRDVDPSSVSRAIAGLEDAIGIRLFQRTTRRLSLTEAGEIYFSRVEALVGELDRAREEARGASSGPVGTLRLTASVTFGHRCIVPHLAAFRREFPDLRLELLLTDANVDLIAERIDLAVRLSPRPHGNAIATKLLDTRYRVCASPAYLATRPRIARPSDLAAHSCVLLDLPDFRSRWRFRSRNGSISTIEVGGDLIISSMLALRESALAGLGPALVVDWLVDDDVKRGDLVDLFPHHEVTATEFDTAAWLLYPSRSHLPFKVRATIDFLRRSVGGAAKTRRRRRAPATETAERR